MNGKEKSEFFRFDATDVVTENVEIHSENNTKCRRTTFDVCLKVKCHVIY